MKDKCCSAGGSVVTVGDNNNKVAEDLVNRPKLGQNQSDSRGQPLPNTNFKTSSSTTTHSTPSGTTTPAPTIYNNSTNAVPNHTTPNNSTLSSSPAAAGATLKATSNHVCSSSPKKPLKLRNHTGGVTELYDTLHNKVSHPKPLSGVTSSGSTVQAGQHYTQVSTMI